LVFHSCDNGRPAWNPCRKYPWLYGLRELEEKRTTVADPPSSASVATVSSAPVIAALRLRARKYGTLEAPITKVGTTLINLQQDTDGFIRMNRHFPGTSLISITFMDGSTEAFLGHQLNEVYEALAV
jgi:hypothetical protein